MDYLITGTRAYGPVTEDSDLDIVVKSTDIEPITDFLIDHKIPTYNTPAQAEYGGVGGFYFDLAGIKVNIIVASSQGEFDDWNRRTERMKTLPTPIKDRETRLAVFRMNEVTLETKEILIV
jgi:hypothetical protein